MSKRTGRPSPAIPPRRYTAAELAAEKKITASLEALHARLVQRGCDSAVRLAQQAARGQGPLVDHFSELGARYAHLLDMPQKPTLRVVQGGREA